jgi:hypothetical protein
MAVSAHHSPFRTVAPFLSLLFVALTLGLTFAHVLEIVGKLRLDGREWLTVQQNLYIAFGPIGGTCEVLAILFAWVTVSQQPRGSTEARYAWTAAVAASVGLVAWALVVAPMNTVLSAWTPESIPADWMRVRNRWEIGHATQAVLYAIAFVALALGPARARPSDSRDPRPS